MSDNKNSVLPDVITTMSNAIQQNLPNTANETDGVISTVVGFFNNVVLYPVKKANLTFRYKLEDFEDDLKKKTQHIPEENLQGPPVMIAGPVLEGLRYTYDEEELREMYENLLASAMDNRTVYKTHPSFVDTIKQMSAIDAHVVKRLSELEDIRCVKFTFNVKNSTKAYVDAMPNYFIEELCELGDPFILSSSLINLQRLGIITIIEGGLKGTDYETIKKHPYVIARETLYRQSGKYDFDISMSKYAVVINNYGKQFIETCLQNS